MDTVLNYVNMCTITGFWKDMGQIHSIELVIKYAHQVIVISVFTDPVNPIIYALPCSFLILWVQLS